MTASSFTWFVPLRQDYILRLLADREKGVGGLEAFDVFQESMKLRVDIKQ